MLLRNFAKTGFIFSERSGFPAARADFVRDFPGDGMGSVKIKRRALDRVQGENLLEKTLFFGFFRTSFHYSGAPEGERMSGWAGGWPEGETQKKSPGMVNS